MDILIDAIITHLYHLVHYIHRLMRLLFIKVSGCILMQISTSAIWLD